MNPSSYRVRVRRIVTTDVYCENCTLAQDESNPFKHATSEVEIDQEDWDVLSVEEDK